MHDAHRYIQEHHDIGAVPPGTRFGWLRRVVTRALAHVLRSQNAFNLNVVSTLDHLQQQQEALQARLDTLVRDAAAAQELLRDLHVSRLQGDEIHRNLTAALEHVRDMQQHHGTVIGMLQQRVDTLTPLISQCQTTIEHVLARLRVVDQTLADLAACQDDLLARMQRADEEARSITARQDDFAHSLQGVLQHTEQQLRAVQSSIAQLSARQDDLVHVQERLATAHAGVMARQDDAMKSVAGLAEQFAEGMRQAGEVGARITRAEAGFTALRAQTERLETQLALLRQTLLDALPHGPARAPARAKKEALIHLHRAWDDAEYQHFEATQRGSEADVHALFAWSLEVLAPLSTTASEYILDLGCGSGAWLALLEAHGKHARGVDVNQAAIATARARGLQVQCQDVFAALEETAADSLPAVTAFHLIEHFEYQDVVRLVRAVMRVLRPGGLFICETPNALNLRVAACEFYQDPTHVRLVHPALLRHVLRATGFTAIEFRFLHPFPPDEQLQCRVNAEEAIRTNFEKLNNIIWGARDCACIARKEASV